MISAPFSVSFACSLSVAGVKATVPSPSTSALFSSVTRTPPTHTS